MTHDVSKKLHEIKSDLPASVQEKLPDLIEISKQLRRDREMAFSGSEDITPSEFFEEKDARRALAQLDQVLAALPKE